jgi:hypothetical protein
LGRHPKFVLLQALFWIIVAVEDSYHHATRSSKWWNVTTSCRRCLEGRRNKRWENLGIFTSPPDGWYHGHAGDTGSDTGRFCPYRSSLLWVRVSNLGVVADTGVDTGAPCPYGCSLKVLSFLSNKCCCLWVWYGSVLPVSVLFKLSNVFCRRCDAASEFDTGVDTGASFPYRCSLNSLWFPCLFSRGGGGDTDTRYGDGSPYRLPLVDLYFLQKLF